MREEDFQALKAAKKAAKLAKRAGGDSASKKRARDDEDIEAPIAVAPPAAAPAAAAPAAAAPAPAAAAPPATSSAGGFTDQWLPCVDCGVSFLFSASEQQFFMEKGYSGAKSRCKDCTAAKKARFGEDSGKGTAERQREARATCAFCGTVGHSKKNCKMAPCYNCGTTGHKSKDCPQPRNNQAGGGVCFKFQTGTCTRGESCRFAHVKE